ncbi:hypothetical protein [Plantactinospora sp. BB1]|uniref:hypothetical protein n=1 Tax=Plantactinospora sp. BB1 TaxID=2071627 RepID=UPI00131F1013|nr:hypothetical protein [Plantactinospora sp. BB1]
MSAAKPVIVIGILVRRLAAAIASAGVVGGDELPGHQHSDRESGQDNRPLDNTSLAGNPGRWRAVVDATTARRGGRCQCGRSDPSGPPRPHEERHGLSVLEEGIEPFMRVVMEARR